MNPFGYREEPRDVSDYGDPRDHGARCDLCPLKGSRFVPYEQPRSGKLRLVVIGEGPGQHEMVLRAPFIGRTGRLLNETLEEVGLSRADCFATNAAMCLPSTDKEADLSAECCAPRLMKELEVLPKAVPILSLGKVATRSILGVRSIQLARGFLWTARDLEKSVKNAETLLRRAESDRKDEAELRLAIMQGRQSIAGRYVFPTIHPAAILRQGSDVWTPIMQLDFQRVAAWLKGELTLKDLADEGPYKVVSEPGAVRKALARLGSEVACDIETGKDSKIEGSTGKNPLTAKILCVGVSDGKRTFVISPWRSRVHAKILTAFMRRRKTWFHNGQNFDTIALARHGVRFLGEVDDTLLAHHAFASHFPQRLDHLVATFLPIATPWKIKHGMRGGAEEKGLLPDEMDPEDLARYNASDARLTARLPGAMKADLESEMKVYEHDKQLAAICKEMQVVGIRRDIGHANRLSAMMLKRATELQKEMRDLTRRKGFQPSRTEMVRKALKAFDVGALFVTKTGLVSTASATLEQVAKADTRAGRFATDMLKWRAVMKSRSTYIEAPEIQPLADGRFHPNWKPFGTVCMPAGELVLTNRGYIDVIDVRRGDLVISHTGVPRKVVARINNGVQTIYRVSLSNGLSLRTTGNHPYRVGDTWVEAAKLKPGVIVTVHSRKPEEWKHLPDWPYEVSSWGRVRRCGNVRAMPIAVDRDWARPMYGRLKVPLTKEASDGRRVKKEMRVHRLVMRMFGPPESMGYQIRHRSGVAWDNTIDNLTYGTDADNKSDARRHGTMSKRLGCQAKLTAARAERIRRESRGPQDDLKFARLFGVSRELVRDVRLRLRWLPERHITGKQTRFYASTVVSVVREPAERTYGLEVEVDHSHVTGGIVTHNSGRLSSRAQSMPRLELTQKAQDLLKANPKWRAKDVEKAIGRDEAYEIESRVREIYIAEPGCELIYYDLSQSEMRAAAYLSGDENFIKSCESGDVHTANAKILFPGDREVLERDPKGEGARLRSVTKNAGFGIIYNAQASTIEAFLRAKGFDVDLKQVESMFAHIHDHYKRYYEYCAENIERCKRDGYLRTAIMGRIRWLGYFPEDNVIYNYPVQSLIADIMNIRLIELRKRLPKSARPVFQGHDSACLEAKSGRDATLTRSLVKEQWAEPIFVPTSGRSFVMPIDFHEGERLSDF